MLRSLLGDLIAQTKKRTKTNNEQEENVDTTTTTTTKRQPPPQRKNDSSLSNRTIIKKEKELPSRGTKRKRNVNFLNSDDDDEMEEDGNKIYKNNSQKNDDNSNDAYDANDDDDDDDSLYRDDEDDDHRRPTKTETSDNRRNQANIVGVDDDNDDDDIWNDSDSQHYHRPAQEYSKALSAIYGPPIVGSMMTEGRDGGDDEGGGSVVEDSFVSHGQHHHGVMFVWDNPSTDGSSHATPTLTYVTPAERKQPRSIRRRNSRTKEWEIVEETVDQIENRLYRHERTNERLIIEARWKTRSYDLRLETDIGGAMYKRAKRQLNQKILKELEDKRRKEREEAIRIAAAAAMARAERNKNKNDDEDEDSIQEQQDVLDRLTQNSMDATTTTRTSTENTQSSIRTSVGPPSISTKGENDDVKDIWTQEDVSVSYRDTMTYWEYGLSGPRKEDLEFRFNMPNLTPKLKNGEELQDADADDDKDGRESLRLPNQSSLYFGVTSSHHRSYGRGLKGYSKREWIPSYYLPTSDIQHPCPRYFQYRTLQAFAARYLCGGSLGEYPKQEDRFLRLLFSPLLHDREKTIAQFSSARTLLRYSHQLGCNALMYSKNIWSNPLQVGQELCLLPPSQLRRFVPSHEMAGRTMNPRNIPNYMKKRRVSVLKRFRTKSRPWRHIRKKLETSHDEETVKEDISIDEEKGEKNGMDTPREVVDSDVRSLRAKEEEEGHMEVADDSHPSIPQNSDHFGADPIESEPTTHLEKVVDDPSIGGGTSTGGVIIDIQTKQSQSVVLANNRPGHTPPIVPTSEGKEILFPTTTFSHIPGTSPPIPHFPLDAVGIVYGPADRHSKYHHQDHVVHHYHFQLALSTLLSRTLMTKNEQGIADLQRRIQTLMHQYVDIANTKGYKRQLFFTRGTARDIPCVQLYRAIQSYCSFWANGFPRRDDVVPGSTKEEEVEEGNRLTKEEDDVADDLYSKDEQGPIPFRDLAELMYVFLDNIIDHNGLIRFSELRITYVLTYLCHKIPIGAARILAEPLNDLDSASPLQIIRRACEYLEENGLILGGNDDTGALRSEEEEGSIRDGELEYIFFEASGKLDVAVKATPLEIQCHLWRIGMLGACLLLSSGNQIGSKAHRYPSKVAQRTYETIGFDPDALDHEVRNRLPKYEEIALQLSTAVSTLFLLARHQPGEYVHRAVADFLEWQQVVALLAGGRLERSIDDIASIYLYHTFQRYTGDDSISARRSIAACSDLVDFHASELERDPGDIQKWRNLVDALGPVGIVSVDDDSKHQSPTCLHSKFIRLPRTFDHQRHNKSCSAWWGSDREWWLHSILKLELISSRMVPRLGDVARRLSDAGIVECEDTNMPSSTKPAMPSESAYLHWLPTRQRQRQQRDSQPSREERMTSFDHKLPGSASIPDSNSSEKRLLSSFLRVRTPRVEVMCYKVFLQCHLVGPGHYNVERSLIELMMRCKIEPAGTNRDTDEWKGLEWLFRVAYLDIPKLILHYYGERANRVTKMNGSQPRKTKKPRS